MFLPFKGLIKIDEVPAHRGLSDYSGTSRSAEEPDPMALADTSNGILTQQEHLGRTTQIQNPATIRLRMVPRRPPKMDQPRRHDIEVTSVYDDDGICKPNMERRQYTAL